MSALAFNSNKVQELRRLLGRRSSRYDERRFVVEGPVLVAEAVAAGDLNGRSTLAAPRSTRRNGRFARRLRRRPAGSERAIDEAA